MKHFKTGLVVGKFAPLHRGHEHLIKQALDACTQLYILSYTRPEFRGCERHKRERWLRTLFPTADICVLDDSHQLPRNDSPDRELQLFTAQVVRKWIGRAPDAVFSSEHYGDSFANTLSEYFGRTQQVQHICVDIQRSQVPISASQIRSSVHDAREFLSPIVYADFVETVCFLGAESTGKSTLARSIAAQHNTAYVQEYGRTLWEEKKGRLDREDLLSIAQTHIALENTQRLEARQFLFVDTSPLTTLFYNREYFGESPSELEAAANRQYDHLYLCAPDFPLVQDGTRGDEAFRARQHD